MLLSFLYLNRLSEFDPPAARIFAWRVLQLTKQGVGEQEAVAVAEVIDPIMILPDYSQHFTVIVMIRTLFFFPK